MRIAVWSISKKRWVFKGKVFVGDQVNPKMPKPVVNWIESAWEYYKDMFKGDREAFAERYLRFRLPGSMALFYRGYVVNVDDGE